MPVTGYAHAVASLICYLLTFFVNTNALSVDADNPRMLIYGVRTPLAWDWRPWYTGSNVMMQIKKRYRNMDVLQSLR